MTEALAWRDYLAAGALPILLGLCWWSWRRSRTATISLSEFRRRMIHHDIGVDHNKDPKPAEAPAAKGKAHGSQNTTPSRAPIA